MNNFFNFTLPVFQEAYGSDWDSFKTITDDNTDYLLGKTWDFYKLNDPNFYTTRVVEIVLDSLGVSYSATETLAKKKQYVRKFLTDSKDKGSADIYLDVQEVIVGTRGVIYTSLEYGSWLWDESTWGDTSEPENILWSGDDAPFYVFIDCKTTDADLLTQIVDAYNQDFLLPAFYKIIIVDSSFNILWVVDGYTPYS